MKKILSVLALVVSASVSMAAFRPITNITTVYVPGVRDEINLVSLTTFGTTYSVATTALDFGTTSLTNGAAYAGLDRMDNLNLNDLATGMPVQWRTVMFGGIYFTNQNGSLPDFFLFEAAGGADPEDNGTVAAVFEGPTTSAADDFLGVAVPVGNAAANNALATGWGNTGSNITANAFNQPGQVIIGIAWDISDLKDAAGVNLSPSTPIKGIAMATAFANLDPCALLAVVPPSGIDHFMVTTTAGSPQLVGVPFDVSITAQDAVNATVNNSFTTVNMTAAGTLMEFDWNQDGTYGDKSGKLTNGLATIKARNKRAETTASGVVAAAGLATTTSAPSVTTVADVFSQLQVLVPGEFGAPGTATGKGGVPTVQAVGASFAITVNAVDLYWNFLAGAPGDTISIFSTNTPPPFTPPASAPLAGGTVNFNITFTNSDPAYVLFATNVSNGLITNGMSAPIISSQSLVWQGDGGAGGSNRWDVLTTANWTNLLGEVKTYTSGSFVTFDDTGSYSPAINIVGTNSPLSVTLNTANNVTFITTNNGGLVGTGSLRKMGTGNLKIANTNSYTGGTVINGGELTVANANGVPNSGALIFTNATLLLEADLIHTNGSTRVVGSPSGSGGSFTIAAVGGNRSANLTQLTWGNIGNNLFPGEVNSQLILGRASDNTTLEIKSRITLSVGGLGGDRRFVVANGSQDVDVLCSAQIDDASATPGNLVKVGAGTLHLSSTANNWDGATVIEEGRLLITGGWANPARTITLGDGGSANATLQLGNASGAVNANVGLLTTSGGGIYKVIGGHPVTNSILTFVSNILTGASISLSQPLGGAGANENQLGLTKATTNYTLTLDAVNTYTGPTTVTAGTLALGASGSINNSTNINVQAGGTFDVSAAGGFTVGAGKTLRGGGAINGNVIANGILTPGSAGIGTLTFSNNLTIGATAATTMEINSTSATRDNITVLGTLTGGGTLTVTNLGTTAALTNGSIYQLFSGPVSGFSSVTLPATPVFLQWTNKLAVDGTIALKGIPTPAPASITSSVSGTNLTLTWPAGQGWTLQAQTNSIAVGIAANWVSVSTTPPYVTPVIPANPTVFYRLWFPVFP